MFKSNRLKNEKGFTLIEVMIAGLITVIVLAGSIYVFVKQDKLIRQENARTDLRALGRLAMTELATEIRRAGYGFPDGQGLILAEAAKLTFYANTYFLMDGTLVVCLSISAAYGFTTLAMLIPAVSEFDVALGRTTRDKG